MDHRHVAGCPVVFPAIVWEKHLCQVTEGLIVCSPDSPRADPGRPRCCPL